HLAIAHIRLESLDHVLQNHFGFLRWAGMVFRRLESARALQLLSARGRFTQGNRVLCLTT
ncbi:MAG: hypothetical protein Q7U34_00865, partial [Anaerolineales bacterium]|nr:hypothetical protein [Anaerolineales bacterium]